MPGRVLADLGARVTRLEAEATSDPLRRRGAEAPADLGATPGALFSALNDGKHMVPSTIRVDPDFPEFP